MNVPNAKICPRCGKVVAVQDGVCGHCARLFRSSLSAPTDGNKTMMFSAEDLPTLDAPPPPPALLQPTPPTRLRLFLQSAASPWVALGQAPTASGPGCTFRAGRPSDDRKALP